MLPGKSETGVVATISSPAALALATAFRASFLAARWAMQP